MSKGKSVLRATLVWGDPGHRVADLRRNSREMSKGKSVSRETLLWGDPSSPGGRQWARCREVDLESCGKRCLRGSVSWETLLWGDPTCTGFLGDLDGLIGR
jgi:hypothetical protein